MLSFLAFSQIGTKAKRRDRGRFSPLSNRKIDVLSLPRTVEAVLAVCAELTTVFEGATRSGFSVIDVGVRSLPFGKATINSGGREGVRSR